MAAASSNLVRINKISLHIERFFKGCLEDIEKEDIFIGIRIGLQQALAGEGLWDAREALHEIDREIGDAS